MISAIRKVIRPFGAPRVVLEHMSGSVLSQGVTVVLTYTAFFGVNIVVGLNQADYELLKSLKERISRFKRKETLYRWNRFDDYAAV